MKKFNLNRNCLDVIRIISCIGIFNLHFRGYFGYNPIPSFFNYVPIFFLLSGFFAAKSLTENKGNFLKKRFTRIYPELWLCVILNLIIILLTYKNGVYSIKDIGIYLITQMSVCQFYTADWLRAYGVGVPNGALWTITVDIQFYIIVYLFYKFIKNNRRYILSVSLLLFTTLSLLLAFYEKSIPTTIWKFVLVVIPSYIWIFIIGMLFYEYKDILLNFAVNTKWFFLMIYVIYKILLPTSITGLLCGVRYNVIETIITSLIIFGFGFSYNFRIKEDYSYSFYLYHMVIINIVYNNFVQKISSFKEYVVIYIMILIVIFIVSFLSKRIISKLNIL